MSAVTVTRFVAESEPHNYLGRDAQPGETFFSFHEPTYGSVDWINGVALSEKDGQYPFFEFPADAIEAVSA